MVEIRLKGTTIHTSGELPKLGEVAPDFLLVARDLSEVSLSDLEGGKKVLNIVPSFDTSICATSAKSFQSKVAQLPHTRLYNISKDLPFAQDRFCQSEGLDAVTLSAFRSSFAGDYGLEIIDGPLKGLCSRVVIVLDEGNKVIYTEQVDEITSEPNYASALQHVE